MIRGFRIAGRARRVGASALLALSLSLSCAPAACAGGDTAHRESHPASDPDGARYRMDPAQRDVIALRVWQARSGDDTAWADPGSSDSGWELQRASQLLMMNGQPAKGRWWYRARIAIASSPDSLDPLHLHAFHNPDAQEIWWDGELIAVNGKLGANAGTERPGKVFQSVRIPPRLSGAGDHLLCVRVSNYRQFSGGIGQIQLGAQKPLINSTLGKRAVLIFLVGIFCIVGIYYFANYIARIQRSYALLAVFCLACGLHTLPVFVALYSGAGLDIFPWACAVQGASWVVMMTTLPAFFLSEFSALPRKAYWAAGALILALNLPLVASILQIIPSRGMAVFERANQILGLAAVSVSLCVTAWATYRRKEGSVAAGLGLLGLAAGVVAGQASESTYGWALGLTLLVLILNASLARKQTRHSLAFRETHLKAARLEIELLKKNIQPHFLLTSLRSITDWLETEPKMAARLVNALASELRMMLKISPERTIALAEEAALCRTHLEVMSLRRHRALDLETHGLGGEEVIPPMVLHTLLEMGLDEAAEGDSGIAFRLERLAGPGLGLRLSHATPLKAGWQRPPDETGIRYVRARLEEAFPGRWELRLDGHPPHAAWSCEIRVTDPAALSARSKAGPLPRPARGGDAVHPL